MTATGVATVASPLQAMSLQEAVTAGVTAPPQTIIVHGAQADVMTTLQLTDPALRAAADRGRGVRSRQARLAMLLRANEIVLGDPFSQLAHLALAGRHRRIVLLEDGASALHAWRVLASEGALARVHERRRTAAMLGTVAAIRLSRAARRTEVVVVGGLPVSSELSEALERRSIRHIRHDFAWARSVELPETAGEHALAGATRIVLGSALCVDGHIRRDVYEKWLRDRLGGEGDVFVPHRRDATWALQLATDLGAHVCPSGHPCAELMLRDTPDDLVIHCFPMTAALTVPIVRSPRPTRFDVTHLVGGDWTPAAPARIVALINEIDAIARQHQPPGATPQAKIVPA